MQVKNPLFIIPPENARVDQKPGGGEPPKYIGDPTKFEGHKRSRITEMDRVISTSESSKPKIDNPEHKFFFEIELHSKALSKSKQPRELLRANNIDLYGQKKENAFLASSSEENFHSFRDQVSRYSLEENRNESAYLSAITKISTIPREDIVVNEDCLEEGETRVFLYLQDVISESDAKTIAKEVQEKANKDSEFFISESGSKVIYGTFSSNFLNEISEPHPSNPFQKIEESIDFITPQETTIAFSKEELKVTPPSLDAKVAVVDSGIKANDIYDDYIQECLDFIKNSAQENLSHGTMVGTRAIFGNDLEDQLHSGLLSAKTKVIDVKVMKEDGHRTSDREVIKALKTVLEDKKYKDIKVFNLSLGDSDVTSIHKQVKKYFTRELDAMAKKHNVIFIVAAGNQRVYWDDNISYPDCLFHDNSVITSPADMFNGISVGSLADTESTRSLALDSEPSPFTRTGLIGGVRKPDLVHFGGNVDKYATVAGIGVKGFSVDSDKLHENVGTSFAAPLVSQVASQIYAYVKESGWDGETAIDLTKALLLHSASYNLPSNSKINPEDLDRVVGFGLPDFSRALDCTVSQATFIYTGSLADFKDEKDKKSIKPNKHKIRFTIPKEMEAATRGKKTIKVKGTLVYTPQISVSGDFDYALSNVSLNLRYINSNGTMQAGNLTQTKKDYRFDWNPVKSFEKTCKAYKGGEWEIWLELKTRGDIDDKYLQKYALVLSIEDTTPDIKERVNLHDIIRSNHKQYNLLEIKARAKVASRG